jgi:hypothetical protein
MGHIRSFQAGEHSAHSQKILNEISTARICLLNPAKKATYDARLQQELAQKQDVTLPTADLPPEPVFPLDFTAARPIGSSPTPSYKNQSWYVPSAIAVAVVFCLGVIAVLFTNRSEPKQMDQHGRDDVVTIPSLKQPPPSPSTPAKPKEEQSSREPTESKLPELASTYGLSRTAKALRVNYQVLKQCVDENTAARGEPEKSTAQRHRPSIDQALLASAFLELASPMRVGPCQFRNRPATALKALIYDGQGFWLCHKKLEPECTHIFGFTESGRRAHNQQVGAAEVGRLRGTADRRHRLRATEPGGNGSAVHAVGGTV